MSSGGTKISCAIEQEGTIVLQELLMIEEF